MLTAPPRGSPPSQAHGVPVLLHGLSAEVLRWHPGGRPDHGRTNHREHGRSHRVESCRSVRPHRVLLPSPPRPPLCSALLADTPFRPHSAPWPAEGLSAGHPEPRRAEGWPWPLGGPGESWMRGSLLAASPVSADGGGAAKSIHFVLHDGGILPKAHIP